MEVLEFVLAIFEAVAIATLTVGGVFVALSLAAVTGCYFGYCGIKRWLARVKP